MYHASAKMNVKAVEQDKRILLDWSAFGTPSTVEWIFTPLAENTTFDE